MKEAPGKIAPESSFRGSAISSLALGFQVCSGVLRKKFLLPSRFVPAFARIAAFPARMLELQHHLPQICFGIEVLLAHRPALRANHRSVERRVGYASVSTCALRR